MPSSSAETLPLISVIVPVYNAAPFLPRCLDSIIHQTYSNLEIICVNDGATDNSADILDEYASRDARIKVIHQENAGVSVARNRGLDAANGEIIGFCDADDTYEADALSYIAAIYEQEVCDIVVTGLRTVDAQGNATPRHIGLTEMCNARILQERMLYDDYIMGSVWNKFFKREIIADSSFDGELTHCEDMHFVSLVLQRYPEAKVLISSKITYNYIVNDASATRDCSRLLDERGQLRYITAWSAILKLYPRDWKMWLLVRSGQFRLIEENIDLFSENAEYTRRLALTSLRYVAAYLLGRKRYPLRERFARVWHVAKYL